jgi:hypothetical protein
MSQKTRSLGYKPKGARQENVRKPKIKRADSFTVAPLLINLGHLAEGMNVGGKVAAYQQIVDELSTIAGRSEHPWTWRYVQGAIVGKIQPGQKFMRSVKLLLEGVSPRRKQWFYFVRRRSVAAVYEKSIMTEMITSQMRSLGFKSVTFSRYMQVKNQAVHR